jgi:hypothetical protein
MHSMPADPAIGSERVHGDALERSRHAMSRPSAAPGVVSVAAGSAGPRDTLALLFALGAVVAACLVVTVAVLHPFAGSMVAERALSIIGRW